MQTKQQDEGQNEMRPKVIPTQASSFHLQNHINA